MNTRELVLIDLSSIAHPIWHMSQSEPNPDAASQKIVARVRALASGHAHVAVCCDSGRSFRKDIASEYKANRPESDAPFVHQVALAKDHLRNEGFPVWTCDNCEADDVIASAVIRALKSPEFSALIVTADKDLLQLVGDRVRAMSVRDGNLLDAEGVKQKFGVEPHQMRDYLTLVGDNSDNVKGAKGIGAKTAADLLAKFGSIDEMYRCWKEAPLKHGFKPGISTALRDFEPHLTKTRRLITLKTDCDIPFDSILAPRVAREVALFDVEDDLMDDQPTPAPSEPVAAAPPAADEPQSSPAPSAVPSGESTVTPPAPVGSPGVPAEPSTALVTRETDAIVGEPVDYERQLDPRSMRDARILSNDMHNSKMFSAYGSPQAVLSTVMVGRELGLPAMSALRSIHNIEGKHALSASLMVALILKSGLAKYFEPVSFDATQATFETKRKGARKPVRVQHTIEMAKQAWSKGDDAWRKSGWGRVPTDMLCARATARLARMVYPDLLAGLYTPEELNEIRQSPDATDVSATTTAA